MDTGKSVDGPGFASMALRVAKGQLVELLSYHIVSVDGLALASWTEIGLIGGHARRVPPPTDETEAMARTPTQQVQQSGRETTLPLANLLLDQDNPRFGSRGGTNPSQADVLDRIVAKFGVDDVLSSLAVNGYFEAEPMVCRKEAGSQNAVVMEGNRRLAACLILSGDDRATRQSRRAEQYQAIWVAHGRKRIDPVPVIMFDAQEQQQELLSYLGVRHIASSQPWDSFAKAAWVAKVVEDSNLSVADVALMIGDQHRTIARLLEGFYFIEQLIDSGEFRAQDSVRRGRGSVTEYPFSWVYTMLGYTTVRQYLELPEDAARRNPLSDASLTKAGLLVRSMFGDAAKGRNSAIDDSRDIGALASVFASSEKISLLEQGKSVEEIERATKPIDQRLRQGLGKIREVQADLISGLGEHQVDASVAEPLLALAHMNRRAALDIERRLREAAEGPLDE